MKFLIFGCNGMAGHMISQYLHEQGHEVLGFARRASAYVPSVTGDAEDTVFVRDVIRRGSFDTVVNCIGVLNQEAERNKSRAIFLNGYFPHFLADITSETGTQVVHISTDCVFSGKRGGYTEADICDGETFYDRTKALGELEDGKNLTLRNSIIGPDINPEGIGLLNWFMKQKHEVNGYTKTIWTGQTTLQLARTIEAGAMERAHGLYNMVPDQTISKYELLRLMNRYLRMDEITIHPVAGVNTDKSLIRTRFDFDWKIPGYETMMEELAAWMRVHAKMYPHYER